MQKFKEFTIKKITLISSFHCLLWNGLFDYGYRQSQNFFIILGKFSSIVSTSWNSVWILLVSILLVSYLHQNDDFSFEILSFGIGKNHGYHLQDEIPIKKIDTILSLILLRRSRRNLSRSQNTWRLSRMYKIIIKMSESLYMPKETSLNKTKI